MEQNSEAKPPLTPAEKGVLDEKSAEDQRAIDEVLVPIEKIVENEQQQTLSALHFERNQPIINEHTNLETKRLGKLRVEASQIRSESRRSSQLARLKAHQPSDNKKAA